MKRLLAIFLSALLVVLLLAGCQGSNIPKAGITYPEGFELYYSQIGQPWEKALKAIGIQESDLENTGSNYYMELSGVSYNGLTCTGIYLTKDIVDRFAGFVYEMEATGKTREATAKTLYDLVQYTYDGFKEVGITPAESFAVESERKFMFNRDLSTFQEILAEDKTVQTGDTIIYEGCGWIVAQVKENLAKQIISEYDAYAEEHETGIKWQDQIDLIVTLGLNYYETDACKVLLRCEPMPYQEGSYTWKHQVPKNK